MRADDNGVEVGKLLTFIGALDGRTTVDAATKYAWGRALSSVTYQQAEDAALQHFTEPLKPGARREWITPGIILQRVALDNRDTTAQVAADVRAARARGIIPRDWPDMMALPAAEREQLHSARERDRQLASAFDEVTPAVVAAGVQDVLRALPGVDR